MNKELMNGVKIEKEHRDVIKFIKKFYSEKGRFPKDEEIYTKIAKDHLREDPKYYTKLRRMKL